MEVHPFAGPLGAEITDVDLASIERIGYPIPTAV